MRGPGLKCLPVLHHGFDTQRINGARESFGRRFSPLQHGNRQIVFNASGINVEHHPGSLLRLFPGGMCRVAFLPQEFARSQKYSRTHFPPDHIGPLVDEQWQVPIAADPPGKRITDNRFRGRPYHQRLGQLAGRYQGAVGFFFESMMGDHCAFLGKAFHMLGLFLQKTNGNEQGKIGISHPRRLKHIVHFANDILPQGISPGFDDHTSPNR